MSIEKETITDIIAEKRARANEIERDVAAKMASGEIITDQYAREVIADLRREADRLEAAWKREKAEVEASALAAGGMVEASRHKQGNAAAMSEALEEIDKNTDLLDIAEDIAPKLHPSHSFVAVQIRKIVRAALSAPPRNFDRFKTKEEAEIEFMMSDGLPQDNADSKMRAWMCRFIDWLFAPAAERKGEGK